MGGVVTEEQAITRAQYMDLVYSQSGMLYEIIPHASRTSNDPTAATSSAKAGSVDGSLVQYRNKSQGNNQIYTNPCLP